MPYIPKNRRDELCPSVNSQIDTPGELNYVMTVFALQYLKSHGLSYDTLADITSAFENAKLEFYRRVAGPYEDQKIGQNGDVYDA